MLSVNYGTKANYTALASKDNDALYFCTDTLEIFKGSAAYSKAVKFVSTLPDGTTAPISQDVIYALPSGELKSYDSSAAQWKTIGVPKTTTVRVPQSGEGAATDDVIPTELAVRKAIEGAKASPVFTGVPEAPTAAFGTDSTQIATTAFVQDACEAIATSLASAFEFKGIVADMDALEAITGQTAGDVYQVTDAGSGKTNAEFVWVDGTPSGSWLELGTVVDLSGFAPLKAPALVNDTHEDPTTHETIIDHTPTAPTAASGDNSTTIATTAFVQGEITDAIDALDIETYAPLESPAFVNTTHVDPDTGATVIDATPTAPTAAAGTNTTQIATTAFVKTAADAAQAAAEAASDPAGSAAAAQAAAITAAESYTDGKLAWVAF